MPERRTRPVSLFWSAHWKYGTTYGPTPLPVTNPVAFALAFNVKFTLMFPSFWMMKGVVKFVREPRQPAAPVELPVPFHPHDAFVETSQKFP